MTGPAPGVRDPPPFGPAGSQARALPLRYTPAGFVLTKRMCFGSDAPKTSSALSARCLVARGPDLRRDVSSTEKEWLVRLSAGMPGGIGNTGHECGAVTSPLVLLGTRYGLREVDRGLPVIFDKGQALCHNFLACHKTLQCREIRGKDHCPRHCISPVLRSPELYRDALDGDEPAAIPAGTRVGYARLYLRATSRWPPLASEAVRGRRS